MKKINDMDLVGFNGIKTEQIATDNIFNKRYIISISPEVFDEINDIRNLKVAYNNLYDGIDDVKCVTDSIYQDLMTHIEKYKSENKELRKMIANLNTRVNNFIAEKQLKEFYEKNSSDKCISSVVEKQLVISN